MTRNRVLLALALLIVGGFTAAGLYLRSTLAPPEPVVHITSDSTRRTLAQGEIVGFEDLYQSHAWLGIPFAAPPVGDLRWRAPREPEPWEGVREAIEAGSPCTQTNSALTTIPGFEVGQIVGSEDCLSLNVWSPRFEPGAVPKGDARLPVMVWIHGGSNTHGAAGSSSAGNLAATQRLVVVSVNYRLGPFGWFRHAALGGGNASVADASGNYGTLDLIRALEWVRANISSFGGDPSRVTVFGESAGGGNIVSLLLSPPAEGLFQRAIVQSGGTWMTPAHFAERYKDDPDEPGDDFSSGEIVLKLLVQSGTATDRGAAKEHASRMADADLASYLRAKPAQEILTAYLSEPGQWRYHLPANIRDGEVIRDGDPLELLADTASYNEVPIIFGTNRDEEKLFLLSDPELVSNRFGLVPTLVDADRHAWRAQHESAMWKLRGADAPASIMRAAQGPTVFVYRFDWDEEPTLLGSDLGVVIGASHGMEIAFVFGHFGDNPRLRALFTDENAAGREELSQRMRSYWAEFAYSGDPGTGRDGQLPRWSAWDDSTAASDKFIVLDTSADGGLRMSSDRVTREGLVADISSDSRMSKRDKCGLYRQFAVWYEWLDEAEYATAGAVGCGDLPLADYPWENLPSVASAATTE